MIKIENLDCDGCPALNLRDGNSIRRDKRQEKIKQWENLREKTVNCIAKIKLFLLCESLSTDRFVYDVTSDYTNGLRHDLRNELVNGREDQNLFEYLKKHGTVIIDCALCPLFCLNTKKDRRLAATLCLERHTHAYLDLNPKAPIITIFPSRCGFLKKKLPDVQKRVKRGYLFTKLKGLKNIIDKLDC